MKEKYSYSTDSATLRQKAEDRIQEKLSESNFLQTEAEMMKLIHELKVHKIELEMQSDELALARTAANDAIQLYDFAPSGYFTLSTEGDILNLNLCASQMLGKDHTPLTGSRFGFFVSEDTRPIYNRFLEKVFISKDKETCEVTLLTYNNIKMHVQLTGKTNDINAQCLIVVADITERKQAEVALKASESKYRELVKYSPDAILIYAGGKIALVNRECLRLMQVTTEEELIGKSVIQFVHPDSRAFVIERMGKAANEGTVLQLEEEKFIRPNGSVVDVEVKALPIKFPNEPAVQLIIRDITERKRAEEALRNSEKQYRDMFYKNTAIKLIVDPSSGLILNANHAAEKFYGYSISELEKMHINKINTLQPEQLGAEMALALNERRKYFNFRHRLASGEVRDVEVYSGPLEFAGSTRLYSIVHDVTDRNLALESLRDMNWRLESIVEGTHVGTWEWNVQTGEAVFNEVWAQIIGYTLDELAPISIKTWQFHAHPEDLKHSNILLQKHFAGELPYFDFDCRMKHKNGQWIWIHDRGRVVTRTEEGKPLMMFGTHTDITERKQTEEALRNNEENLQKSNAEKDKFFSIIAHDLRSPFNGFLGLTEIMVEGLPGMKMEEIQQMAILLKKSATNLFSLLGNLLEWSRMQRGLTAFVPTSFLLMPKIFESLVLVKDAADKKDILISYAVSEDLTVFADTNMLGGILRNLVTNAVKFTPRGGIITVSAKSKSENSVEISVRDTGIGMNKKLIANLFHLDVNTNRKGTDNEYSTGLGLLICKDFIEKNGGKLDIKSEEGKGSDFRFTVPIEQCEF